MPAWQDEVCVDTSPSGHNGLLAWREFVVRDAARLGDRITSEVQGDGMRYDYALYRLEGDTRRLLAVTRSSYPGSTP